ncbi:MAG: type II toxin-antitoxin system HicB family antitoxin [Ottowia sp.]|nr:type II toxin-antitoxin system HicB family antitoxin [Ottowia sp.]
MNYKGYTATISFDDEAGLFTGQLAGIRDCILFQSDNATGLRQAFEEAVDDYLQCCEEIGKAPQRPFSGRMMLRVPPALHAAASSAAAQAGQSLNEWMQRLIARETGVAAVA